MIQEKQNVYAFPNVEDKVWVEEKNILKKLKIPNVISGIKIIYAFDKDELIESEEHFKNIIIKLDM
jgi:hypothetical protein